MAGTTRSAPTFMVRSGLRPDWLSNSRKPRDGSGPVAYVFKTGRQLSLPGQYPLHRRKSRMLAVILRQTYGERYIWLSQSAQARVPGPTAPVTFDDPLTIAFRESNNHNAYVYFPAEQNGHSVVASAICGRRKPDH